MGDPSTLLAVVSIAMLALVIVIAAALRAWQGWLEVKRIELGERERPAGSAHQRIELADLRERVRRLEAIADGNER